MMFQLTSSDIISSNTEMVHFSKSINLKKKKKKKKKLYTTISIESSKEKKRILTIKLSNKTLPIVVFKVTR
jgi:hypothetical protein